MFFLYIKRFLKSPFFLIGTIIFVVVVYLIQPVHEANSFEDISNSVLITQPICFFYFLFFSYFYFSKTENCNLEETIAISKHGIIRDKIYVFLVFLLLDMILYFIYVSVAVLGAATVMKTINYDWLILILKAFLIYHFMLYVFAILIGMAVSFIHSKIKGLALILLLYLFFSKAFTNIILQIAANNEYGTHVLDILGIINRNYNYYSDMLYNYSVECVNIERITFWILLVITIIYIKIHKKKKKISTTLLVFATVLVLIGYLRPSGYRYYGGNWGNELECQQYYLCLFNTDKEGIARRYKQANFHIKKYQGKLSAKRILNATINVIVDEDNLKEYCFTLYHGYKIKNVFDDKGRRLSFEQDGDHVLIKNYPFKPIKSIRFEYEGYSRKYVATSQAIFLGGNFPYLPQPGWREYMSEPKQDGDTNVWNIDIDLGGLGYKTEFDILFYSNKQIFSNLNLIEDSHYTGVSEGATFVASDFMREIKIGDTLLYYPVLSPPFYKKNIETTQNEYEEMMAKDFAKDIWRGMKIFDVGYLGDGDDVYYFSSDHIIGNLNQINMCLPYYLSEHKTPTLNELSEYNKKKEEHSND